MPGASSSSDTFDLFISYAHKDDHDGWITAFVEVLKREHAEFSPRPLEVFFDLEDIRAMDDWEDRILRGLKSSKLMLAVLSPDYFDSLYCRKEWEVYLEHELARAYPGEGVAPIYVVSVPGFEQGQAEAHVRQWAEGLQKRQFLDVRSWREEGIEALRREDVVKRMRKLEEQIHERLDRANRASTSPTSVPLHNPNFVGRRDELSQLRKQLALGKLGAITAVYGLGGMGKSALAFEYAHAFADEYPGGRFLIPCEGVKDLRVPIVSHVAPKRGIELTDDEKKNMDAAFARVRAELEGGPTTLLLLDNLDQPESLTPEARSRCLPGGENVHVLATTRLEPAKLLGVDCLSLDALPENDALRLLELHRPFAGDDERQAALSIVRRLGGHALAVEVVAVFLWKNPDISCAGYLARLEEEGLGALEGAGSDELVHLSRHPETLIGPLLKPTLDQLTPPERCALEYAALLPADAIGLPWLKQLVGQAFPERRLIGLRLFTPTDEPRIARVHRVVQDVVRSGMPEETTTQWREKLNVYLQDRGHFLFDDGWIPRGNRWEIEPLRTCALFLMDRNETAGATVANSVQGPLGKLGNFTEARELLRRAIAIDEKAYKPDDPDLAISYSNLALVEQDLGNLAEARELLRRAIAIQEKAYEADHPALATGYSNLATVEQDLGNLAEARELLRRAIPILENAYEPDHPNLAFSYSALGWTEKHAGDFHAARDWLRRAIAIEEKAFQTEHPHLARECYRLAIVESDLKNLPEAISLMTRAYQMRLKCLPAEHADTQAAKQWLIDNDPDFDAQG